MKTPITFKVVNSTVSPALLSLRVVENGVTGHASDLRRAIATHGYQPGDTVVLVDSVNTVLTPADVESLRAALTFKDAIPSPDVIAKLRLHTPVEGDWFSGE